MSTLTTPEKWQQMEEASITLLAASSLIAAGGTGEMDNGWAKAALAATLEQDAEALLAAGDLLLPPCEGCHQQFNPAVIGEQP
jgi:hypothetical protein